nr:capsular biosynthesis protein [Azomonas macrocytogenes]
MPFPAVGRLAWVISRIDWRLLVEEKCQERRVKGKYQGFIYRWLLRLEMLIAGLRIQALLERSRPDAVVVWNGSNRLCRILLSLLPEHTGTFFFENGLLPDTTTLDPRGVNYENSVPREAAFYRRYAAERNIAAEAAPVVLVPRKNRSAGKTAIELPERFIFIPFQVDIDSQVRLFSPWVRNMRELFAIGERLARETGICVVFKEHPSSRESYPDLHARASEQLLFANGNGTQELIEASLLVITLNSTVGLESLLLGKPVLTLGQAFFNIGGVTMHADSTEEVVSLVRRYPDWPLDESLRKAFLHYLKNSYCVPGAWKRSGKTHLLDVAQRMQGQLMEHDA